MSALMDVDEVTDDNNDNDQHIDNEKIVRINDLHLTDVVGSSMPSSTVEPSAAAAGGIKSSEYSSGVNTQSTHASIQEQHNEVSTASHTSAAADITNVINTNESNDTDRMVEDGDSDEDDDEAAGDGIWNEVNSPPKEQPRDDEPHDDEHHDDEHDAPTNTATTEEETALSDLLPTPLLPHPSPDDITTTTCDQPAVKPSAPAPSFTLKKPSNLVGGQTSFLGGASSASAMIAANQAKVKPAVLVPALVFAQKQKEKEDAKLALKAEEKKKKVRKEGRGVFANVVDVCVCGLLCVCGCMWVIVCVGVWCICCSCSHVGLFSLYLFPLSDILSLTIFSWKQQLPPPPPVSPREEWSRASRVSSPPNPLPPPRLLLLLL